MRKPKPLQNFGFKESPYERPNQKWVCGKKANGFCCEVGPNKNGICRADYQCKPVMTKDGEQWRCNRSNTSGGRCEDGPLPDGTCCKPITLCRPSLSVKYKRSYTVRWAIIMTLGLLLIALSGSYKQQFISSGDLTYQHANNAECSDCHDVFEKGVSGWIHQAINSVNIIENSKQCLNCHELGSQATFAHSLSEDDLRMISHALDSNQDGPEYKNIACTNCHIEHHGSHNNLLAVSSQNCASCHDLPYKNARKVHPQFGQYPYPHRTGIIFDHTQHYDKHFYDKNGENLDKNAPDSCLTCHYSDNNGIKMIVRDYQKTCSDCHNDIFDEAEAFPFITIPTIDVDDPDLLGNWPDDTYAELTPFVKLMLASEARMRPVLVELESNDVSDLEEPELEILAWSIKDLFYDIYNNGESAVAERYAFVFNCQINSKGNLIQEPACHLTEDKLDSLVNHFPYTLFCSAVQEWFPKLPIEISLYNDLRDRSKYNVNKGSSYCQSIANNNPDQEGHWEVDDFSIGYRITEHEDKFFVSWINASSSHLTDEVNNNIRMEIFSLINSEDSPSQCIYCHSMDNTKLDNYLIHWSEEQWNPKRKDFVRFNHADHLKHHEEDICQDCHIEDKDSDYLATYKNNTPQDFESSFKTEKEICETCHEQAMTKNQCQTCHNYHISGSSEDVLLSKGMLGRGELKIWTDKQNYSIGDNIVISFSVDRAMYVRIVRIDSSGKILSLFPNEFRAEHYCKPNIVYQIPKSGSKRQLVIKPPAGTDKLFGIGSDNPIPENVFFFTDEGEFDKDKMNDFPIRFELDVHVEE